jgi:hypothetical protein
MIKKRELTEEQIYRLETSEVSGEIDNKNNSCYNNNKIEKAEDTSSTSIDKIKKTIRTSVRNECSQINEYYECYHSDLTIIKEIKCDQWCNYDEPSCQSCVTLLLLDSILIQP